MPDTSPGKPVLNTVSICSLNSVTLPSTLAQVPPVTDQFAASIGTEVANQPAATKGTVLPMNVAVPPGPLKVAASGVTRPSL